MASRTHRPGGRILPVGLLIGGAAFAAFAAVLVYGAKRTPQTHSSSDSSIIGEAGPQTGGSTASALYLQRERDVRQRFGF